MSGILNTTGAVSGILGSSVLPSGVTGGSGLDTLPLSNRNLIINGGMQVAQRSSLAFAHDGNIAGYSEVDRYRLETASLGEWDGTLTQHDMTSAELNTTGFGKALKLTTGTAESSIGSDDLVYITQKIEAQNLQHLQYGTASAKTVTLSFWVKTSVAGTYSLGLYKADGTARTITATYTTTGTGWEYKTITFAGDTDATGTIVNDNGAGFYLFWVLATGSTYDSSENTSWHNYANASFGGGHAQDGIITTGAATFYITGVQLEIGSVATPFEHRDFADVELRCQRYFLSVGEAGGSLTTESDAWRGHGNAHDNSSFADGNGMFTYVYPVDMRTGVVTFTAVQTHNGSGAALNNTNFAPFTSGSNKKSVYVKKNTDSVAGNQNTIYVTFTVSAEL